MKKHKNIERIKYIAYHHKKVRVRKKNMKRLQKYGVLTLDFRGFAFAINRVMAMIGTTCRQLADALTQAFRSYPQDPLRLVDNVDRCVCCDEIIPEGRQVCPSCEGGAER
jgi:hypothetical protein